MFFKHLNRSSSRVGVGLFCVWIGLFCVRIELFCAWIGLFCVSRHVSFESTCLIRRIWIDLWVGALVSSCACEFVHLNRDSFIRVETLFCVNWSLWRVNRSHFSMNTSLLCLITGLYWSDISFVGYDSSARTHKSNSQVSSYHSLNAMGLRSDKSPTDISFVGYVLTCEFVRLNLGVRTEKTFCYSHTKETYSHTKETC